MKKCLITTHLSFLMSLAISSTGQDIDQQVIASAGNDIAAGNIQVSSTIGQFLGATSLNNSIYLTEGFFQADPITVLSTLPELEQKISIFPNPTTDYLSIASSAGTGNGSYQLANMDGKIVKSADNVDFSINQEISLHQHADGVYLLTIKMPEQASKQFKIIKK